jgi:hypothetical protein
LKQRTQLADVAKTQGSSGRKLSRHPLGAGGDKGEAMNKMQHSSNNGVLGAPAGWDQNELPCGALPVTHTECDGVPAVVSYWKPSANELALLAEGAAIALWVIGRTMPPVSLMVEPA